MSLPRDSRSIKPDYSASPPPREWDTDSRSNPGRDHTILQPFLTIGPTHVGLSLGWFPEKWIASDADH